ncbi:hypothetical protein [Agromyces archimandritae]|uniref:Camelysin metallo-endopeptidase n=1 Tax=Agromyces archimandritae TaxID=2781962 RepID=A0A975FJR7_9MICO|nr:hypothetical protein [Agromyces archimandritae]QTX03324.1 hypothetical protein G127AT_07970 [Agromyces archimandritae]
MTTPRSRAVWFASAAVLAVGGALAAGATSAAFTDEARLVTTGRIGSPFTFDIGVVDQGGMVRQADGPAGIDWPIAGADTLVPGHSITTELTVFNNTRQVGADTTVSIVLRNDDGAVADKPNITGYLRFTARIDGVAVFEDRAWADAEGSIGVLAARGTAPLADGAAYTAGNAGSERNLELTITYLDADGVEYLNGGQAAIALSFDAEATATAP